MKIEDTNLVLLQKEFPKLVWSKDKYIYKGVSNLITIELDPCSIVSKDQQLWSVNVYFTNQDLSDRFDIDLLFSCQLWNCLEMAIDGTKEFIKEVSKAIIDLI